MKFWYFLFEGIFKDRHLGVYSSAMLPSLDLESAQRELIINLKKEGIDLLKIDDQFEFKISEVDVSNADNAGWVSLYEAVKLSRGCVFTPWQMFEI